jgi:hypothetical protein
VVAARFWLRGGAEVHALAVYDGGSGPLLCAAGLFDTVGGISAPNFAFWNGISWSVPPVGPDRQVLALAVFDDGQGGEPQLYAGGSFSRVGTTVVRGIARWDGSAWSKVGIGFDGSVPRTGRARRRNGSEAVRSRLLHDRGWRSFAVDRPVERIDVEPARRPSPANIRRLGVYDDGSDRHCSRDSGSRIPSDTWASGTARPGRKPSAE